MDAILDTLSKCTALPKEVETEVAKAAVAKKASLLTEADGLIRMGPLLGRLTQAQIDGIDKDVLAEALSDLVDKQQERDDDDDKRCKSGFKDEKTAADREDVKSAKSKVMR